MDDQEPELLPPHVLIFPFPAQGHVNCMLKLAELLCLAGLHVTLLLTHHTHNRLLRYANVLSSFSRYPGFRFETISDGLPSEHPRSSDQLSELFDSIKHTSKPLLKEIMLSTRHHGERRPVTCVIADGILGFAMDAAEEVGVPIIYFRTIGACAFWAFFCIPRLIEAGELPFKGNEMDEAIENVPGMEDYLRRRDLPSFCRVGDLADPVLRLVIDETQNTTRGQALILNTFEDLEGPILAHIRTRCPKLYTIGPLHLHVKTRLIQETKSSSLNSTTCLWEQDRSCLTWLDSQPLKSVIYVSFGSITPMTKDQVMEFCHGLVNSGKRFLWVIRPDSVKGWEGQIPAEVREGTKERGYIVGWAPQEEVLAHQAVGGFLTHSGWNSTLESMVVGVPMICWPYFGDQQVNSRFVSEVWKLGLDMKDTCDRVVVEKMVRDLMEKRRDESILSADQMGKMARESVREGGSSYSNLDRLIDDIRLMIMGGEK
ncbi:7-deoxyloganetic acid glucosyl transferase-like [Cornus florida]|uniref:7-deoxyloganetic acid glucosyl transferase-like n=1 Tax=Cornus florida TaxID=4283 RepID=UPI0028A0683B|nr:7-deoxyloganetic acid glucosyl transferase-like [Cornus florida]